MRRSNRIAAFVALVAVCSLTGCNGGTKVDGQVTNGSGPYKPVDGESISLIFDDVKGGNNYNATPDANGNFSLRTADGGGIPSGKYRLRVMQYTDAAKATAKKPAAPPEEVEYPKDFTVEGGTQTITIDLSLLPQKKKK